MVFATTVALVACKAAAPQATSSFCGFCWSCVASASPYAGQAGAILGAGFAISKHIDQSEARKSQMKLETDHFTAALALVRRMDVTIAEKQTIDKMEQQIKESEESLTGHSMFVSTKYRLAQHMTAMSTTTADLQAMAERVMIEKSCALVADTNARTANESDAKHSSEDDLHGEDNISEEYDSEWNIDPVSNQNAGMLQVPTRNHKEDPLACNEKILKSMESIQKRLHAIEIMMRTCCDIGFLSGLDQDQFNQL